MELNSPRNVNLDDLVIIHCCNKVNAVSIIRKKNILKSDVGYGEVKLKSNAMYLLLKQFGEAGMNKISVWDFIKLLPARIDTVSQCQETV